MPLLLVRALRYIFSVNLLTTTSSPTFAPVRMPVGHAPPDEGPFHGGAHTLGKRLCLESVMTHERHRVQSNAHRHCRWGNPLELIVDR
jgi:hypothetical protein